MVTSYDQIATLAQQHGLARARLFRDDISREGEHEILLDGAFGSFAVSIADDIDPLDASSWVWSSNVPHHVLMTGGRVRVIRWDRPDEISEFDARRVLDNPVDFYEHLRSDRTIDPRTIVEHSMSLFKRVRNLVHHADLPDEKSIAAYLAFLGLFASGQRVTEKKYLPAVDNAAQLPDGAREIVSLLPQGEVETLYDEFRTLKLGNRSLAADVSLAIRHASGAIFQEAHHVLVQGPPPDLFNYVAPATARKPDRGGVHFTPPFLARALSEQVLQALGDIKNRKRIVIADIACGSAAFLVEALRALERMEYRGHITLVGRDTSPIAIDMARFVLGVAGQEWPGNSRIALDIEVADSLQDNPKLLADAVVMNPPFTRWQELDTGQRELLYAIVGKHAGARPDLSTAFVERALDIVKPDGAVATLLPANALDAKSASVWRSRLSERKQIFLSALFDDQGIFSHARVRVGALVLTGKEVQDSISIHAGSDPENAGDSLRALRLKRWSSNANAGFSLSLVPAARSLAPNKVATPVSADWSARLGRLRPLTTDAQQSVATRVGDIFDVRQGIRTGENSAFVLDHGEWLELPEQERPFFRPAISSKGIVDGRITQLFYVFYPYGDERTIKTERDLRERLPRFSVRYLEPSRQKLAQRRAKHGRWWELSERRSGMENAPPVFVSKYWAKPGGFVRHGPAQAVVLQGFGWVIRQNTISHLPPSEVALIELAYLALLNSEAFFNLIAEHAPPTGGGQFDMSPRYILDVPLIDLFSSHDLLAREINILAKYAFDNYEQDDKGSDADKGIAEATASAVLGLKSAPPKILQAQNLAGGLLPDWVEPFVETGHEGTDRAYRVTVLAKLQELARSGDYSEIDVALSQAPVSQLAETSMMTLLRGSYRFKTKLKDWDGFRDRVAAELHKRGAAVKRLLIGLYE